MNMIHHHHIDNNHRTHILQTVKKGHAQHQFFVNGTPVNVRYGQDGSLQELITKMIARKYTGKTGSGMLYYQL